MWLNAEPTLKFKNDIKSKIFTNSIFELKVITHSGLIFKPYLQFLKITDNF